MRILSLGASAVAISLLVASSPALPRRDPLLASAAGNGAVHRVSATYDGILPDATQTPGATNPSITQANIAQNICNPHWTTRSIRPPSSYTSALKRRQLAAGYAVNGDVQAADYEEDHLISLELGGNPTDARNLWPEPWHVDTPNGDRGAYRKDHVENATHDAVCAGRMTLLDAQHSIATDWVALGRRLGLPEFQ